MARPWPRRHDEDPGPREEDDVHLDDADQAWWTQADVARPWSPRDRSQPAPAPARDILAEHFGEDWRTSFGFDEDSGTEDAPDERDPDPYQVLGVAPDATWEEIVAAHRHQAREHHPDGLFGRSEEEQAASEERIRLINAAIQELRVRRER